MASGRNEGVVVETLFVGCTRPTTVIGVPLTAFVVEGIAVIELFIWTRNLLQLLNIIPFHAIFYVVCLKEPRFFELIFLWGITKGENLMNSFRHWRASSYSPLSIRLGRKKAHFKGETL